MNPHRIAAVAIVLALLPARGPVDAQVQQPSLPANEVFTPVPQPTVFTTTDPYGVTVQVDVTTGQYAVTAGSPATVVASGVGKVTRTKMPVGPDAWVIEDPAHHFRATANPEWKTSGGGTIPATVSGTFSNNGKDLYTVEPKSTYDVQKQYGIGTPKTDDQMRQALTSAIATPPVVAKPAVKSAPAAKPKPVSVPQLVVQPTSGLPPGSVAKNQTFTVNLVLPPGAAAPGEVKVNVNNPNVTINGSQTVTLTKGQSTDLGTSYVSQPIKIEGKDYWFDWITVKNGGVLTASADVNGTHVDSTFKVYDTPVKQAVGRNEDLIHQVQTQLTTAKANADKVIAAIDHQIALTTDPAARAKLQGLKGKANAAKQLADQKLGVIDQYFTSINWAETHQQGELFMYTDQYKFWVGRSLIPLLLSPQPLGQFDVSNALQMAANNARNEISEIQFQAMKLLAIGLYQATTELTLAGPVWTLLSPIVAGLADMKALGGEGTGSHGMNIWGQAATTEDYLGAATTLLVAAVLMKGMPVVIDAMGNAFGEAIVPGFGATDVTFEVAIGGGGKGAPVTVDTRPGNYLQPESGPGQTGRGATAGGRGGAAGAAPETPGWARGFTPAADEAGLSKQLNAFLERQDTIGGIQEVQAEVRLARQVGVPEEDIARITARFNPEGNPTFNKSIASSLMKERLKFLGYDLEMPAEEFNLIQEISVRAQNDALTPNDVKWLQEKIDGNKFDLEDQLNRGYVTEWGTDDFLHKFRPTEGFISALQDIDAVRAIENAFVKSGGRLPVRAESPQPLRLPSFRQQPDWFGGSFQLTLPKINSTTGAAIGQQGVVIRTTPIELTLQPSSPFVESIKASVKAKLGRNQGQTPGAASTGARDYSTVPDRLSQSPADAPRITPMDIEAMPPNVLARLPIDNLNPQQLFTLNRVLDAPAAPMSPQIAIDLNGLGRSLVDWAMVEVRPANQQLPLLFPLMGMPGGMMPSWFKQAPALQTVDFFTQRPATAPHNVAGGWAACSSCHPAANWDGGAGTAPTWLSNPASDIFHDVTPGLFIGQTPPGSSAAGVQFTLFNQVPGTIIGTLPILNGVQDVGVEGGTFWIGPPAPMPSASTIGGLVSRAVDWIESWFAPPAARQSRARPAWFDVATPLFQGRAAAATAAQAATNVLVSFTSTGNASGDAIRMHVFNPTRQRIAVTVPDGLVLEPVSGAAPPPPAGTQEVAVQGYCVDFAKAVPPPAGTYRIANRATQDRFSRVKSILRAARQLDNSGVLHPDSDPKQYGQAIRQYSLWSRIENWGVQKFTENFVERTKKNLAEAKQPWTRELESTVRALAPGRWQDILRVFDRAERIAAR